MLLVLVDFIVVLLEMVRVVDYLGCFGCDGFSLVFACIDCGGFVSLCLWVRLVMWGCTLVSVVRFGVILVDD